MTLIRRLFAAALLLTAATTPATDTSIVTNARTGANTLALSSVNIPRPCRLPRLVPLRLATQPPCTYPHLSIVIRWVTARGVASVRRGFWRLRT